MNILIVDDSENTRDLLQRMLKKEGHSVVAACNGVEALEVLRREPVAVILADIMMPQMDGYRLCQAVRRDELHKQIPFIIYTANCGSPADEKMAIDLGADAFLRKPATAATILETLQRVMSRPRVEPPPLAAERTEAQVMQEYSDRLVTKLEQRNDELAQLNKTLSESEARYRLLADAAEDFVTLNETEGPWLYVSPSYYRVTGWTPEEIQSTDWRTRLHADDLPQIERTRAANLAGETTTIEHRIRCRDGRWIWVESRCKPILGRDGKVQRLLVWAREVTERKQVEAQFLQAQKMEAIGQLAGGIAHDFNNILAAILGNVELARISPPDDPGLPESLNAIYAASRRAADLVKQILAFSRRQEQARHPIELHVVVREVVKLLRSTLSAAIEFQTNVTRTRTVLADASQIHQVVMNLCTNAAHAMKDRPGVLQVELTEVVVDAEFAQTRPDLRPGPYVSLRVADSGRGMDRATLDRIFEPFFTTKAPGEGTGLGLSVVHGIVKNHDGGITVESEPGVGTTFHLYFPVFEASVAELTPDAPPVPVGHGEHILFVDDEDQLARLGETMLKRLGYRVTAVTNVLEAISIFRAQPDAFDLVITDLNMPVMNGTSFARQLLATRPKLKIILTTGYSATLTPEMVREMGFRELLPKPAEFQVLAETVQRVVAERNPA